MLHAHHSNYFSIRVCKVCNMNCGLTLADTAFDDQFHLSQPCGLAKRQFDRIEVMRLNFGTVHMNDLVARFEFTDISR